MANEIKITVEVDTNAVYADLCRLVALKGPDVLEDEAAVFEIVRKHSTVGKRPDILDAEVIE